MDNRALIFANLVNGVPPEQVARDFRQSEAEVMQVFAFVLRKIKSYCFMRSRQKNAVRIITASNLKEAKDCRVLCLSVLPKLNLDNPPEYKDIQHEVVTPDNVMAVARNLNA